MNEEWNTIDRGARFLKERLGARPDVHLVLGSGLGGVADGLEDSRAVRFDEVPGWTSSTVDGHAGELRRGRIAGVEVLLQMGRIHLYEGHTAAQVVRPIRVGIAYGAKTIILTNAAGAINEAFRAGDLMMIEDHLNLTGVNPLTGPNNDARGERFPDMTNLYCSNLRATALNLATDMGITLRSGVYAGVNGPSYETPSEVQMMAQMGVDAVGMSTVLEAIAARHMGARICGISCITNQAASVKGAPLSHDEVKVFAAKASDDMIRLLAAILGTQEE